ncbi:MAG: hypothetical protein A2847_00070 [Candidatus Sungbacteria bacterium RIFCSPHIGHO2_01_FULL_50_25]|uniref:Uncharacterized protein n=1 Tax=Candidatus Sungbacteria bacterium RIFCSPHIGHO2_01_FULL_50_25 TaxID=1802265 RepID=A0A1G2KC70_9BACT|nr:MAG: hypothetical protein A2847_00070 [Candidatus Sungbacteria bacterium RIFCSPHIGHO2_01_FULL_50_25]
MDFTAAPTPILSGSPAELNFFVNEKPRGDPIDASLLQVEHEKRMHVIGVRSDLNEFFHIHPNPTSTPGVFTVRGAFSKPGVYKIWSETKKDGVIHAIGHQEFSVLGEGAVSEKIVSFGRSVISGEYQVSLELDEPVIKGREYDLSFDIHARAGKEVGFEDYLGAKMHVVVISDDLREFIHTHPEEEDVHEARGFVSDAYAHGGAPDENTGAADETVDFHVTFPRAGLYRVFAQFRPQGANLPPDEALFAGFWVRVDEKAPQQVSEWWGLFLGSLIAIALLSILVKKFIAVKPISAPKAGA